MYLLFVIKNKVWKICSSIIHAEWKTEYTRENETEPVDGRHMFYKGGVKSYSNELFSIHRILIYYPQSDTHIREGLLYSNSVWTITDESLPPKPTTEMTQITLLEKENKVLKDRLRVPVGQWVEYVYEGRHSIIIPLIFLGVLLHIIIADYHS